MKTPFPVVELERESLNKKFLYNILPIDLVFKI